MNIFLRGLFFEIVIQGDVIFFACSDYMPHYYETVVQRFQSDLFKTVQRDFTWKITL